MGTTTIFSTAIIAACVVIALALKWAWDKCGEDPTNGDDEE